MLWLLLNMQDYQDWKAPRDDGQTLLWPDGPALAQLARSSGETLGRSFGDVLIAGERLDELRRQTRKFLGHADESPLIVTGHQAELYHPGVWSKNAAIDAVARCAGGKAMHLSVDTDAPKHLVLRWPGEAIPITDDEALNTSAWTGRIDAPTPSHLAMIETRFNSRAMEFGFDSMLQVAINSMRRSALEGIEGTLLPHALPIAMHEIDFSLGLDYSVLTLSPVLQSKPWLAFVWHLLSNASRLAADYNLALAEYRELNDIKGNARPMPDMMVTSTAIELPLWVDDLSSGRRHRANVEVRQGELFLHSPYSDDAIHLNTAVEAGSAVTSLADFLRTHNLRLAPRALTLTTFARLLFADVFIHGIGGGRYDQITDRFVQKFFRVTPPSFAVATATLLFPTAIGRTRLSLPSIIQQGHKIKHSLSGDRKRKLVDAIAREPRRSQERSLIFQTMHSELAGDISKGDAMTRWREMLERCKKQHIDEQILFSRELFYALQPRTRLSDIIDSYRSRF